MQSALHAIARPSVCPSVRLSVCHTGGSVKMVEVKIMQFSAYSSPIPLVLRDNFVQKFWRVPPERGVKQGWDGEKEAIF